MPRKPLARDISESLGKLPPQALDLEEAVIGAIILSPRDLETVILKLRADHFYTDAHREIYNAIFNLWMAKEPIDMRTVVHALRASGKIEQVGGAYYIAELTSKVHSAANIEYHARIIMEMAMKRRLIQMASSIHTEAYEDTTDIFEFIQRVQDDINGLVAISIPPTRPSLAQYIDGHRFDSGMPPTEDDAFLFIGDTPIGSRENIIAITGKSKSRKTVVAGAIVTSFFKADGHLGFISHLDPEAKILHVDTEQGRKHYWHSVERIFRDAGMEPSDRFVSVHTRDADIPLRLELIDHMVEEVKPAVLIIDGVTDLVYDINDQEEATKMGERFLRLSSVHRLLVIVVIHTTKTTGFMTGAIGTIFEKKSETVIKVELDEENNMASHVTCQFSRNRPFADFTIKADEHGNYSIENEANIEIKGEILPARVPLPDSERLFIASFGHNLSISFQNLSKNIRFHSKKCTEHNISTKNARLFIDDFEKRGFISKQVDGTFIKGMAPINATKQLEINNGAVADDMPF